MPCAVYLVAMSVIVPPEGTYFIHGMNSWGRNGHFKLFEEISVSLQKDGHTTPLRDFGFILDIERGGVIAAFDRDVTSKVEDGKKVFSWQSRKSRNYAENELDELMSKTPKNKHNELWVRGDMATIVGGYVTGESRDFRRSMEKKGLPIRIIPVE